MTHPGHCTSMELVAFDMHLPVNGLETAMTSPSYERDGANPPPPHPLIYEVSGVVHHSTKSLLFSFGMINGQ